MECFQVNILGCGSALPTTRHFLSSQVVNFREKLFMIDCGEGTQLQFRAMKLKFQRLNHIFISHLHGDHCFGLPGLISTLGMLGRTADLHLYAQPAAPEVFQPVLDYFCRNLPYCVVFHSFDPSQHAVIYEDRTMKVSTIPLKHRVPCAGFLFEEKPKDAHIIREMMDFYKVPISQINAIKKGADFVTPEGKAISHTVLTRPAEPSRKYAYCSDTAYFEKIIPLIEGVNVLYHESTYAEENLAYAGEYFHSSARQAAQIARAASAGRLVLGHFSARYPDETLLLTEAQEIFPNTILANERMLINIAV
ncbi:MAG: ribonuclease Z [Dysgonamonadaceae bacterium]|jgi:ribonuclease Z|nr:ribonuclease Z [Dysgonamonadaceae bacterium]